MPPKRPAPSPANDEKKSKKAATSRAKLSNGTHTTSQKISQPEISKGDDLNSAPTRRLNIFVFGGNDSGELGLGPSAGSDDVVQPTLNPYLKADTVGVVHVAVGGMHCAALTHDNQILTWGVNDAGALGRDTTWDGGMVEMDDAEEDIDADVNPKESIPRPVELTEVPTGTVFTQLAASDNATFALTSKGTVYGWGSMRSTEGASAFEDGADIQKIPVLISGLNLVTKIFAGNNHLVALTERGDVFTWGFGSQGQLGRRIMERRGKFSGMAPGKLGLKNIVDVAAGADHSFAIHKDGMIYSWGLNNLGQTGIFVNAGGSSASFTVATLVKSLGDLGPITQITAGNRHTFAIKKQGECFALGQLDAYATGLKLDSLQPDTVQQDERGNPKMLLAPVQIPHLDVTFVAAGGDHSIAITRQNQVYTWGFNNSHQTGHKDDGDVETPTPLNHPCIRGKTFVWAGAGGNFSLLAEKAISA